MAFYFSFITLSTVGYGDITPVSRIARWLAAMEAMTGLLYVAVLIARLVSLYSVRNLMIPEHSLWEPTRFMSELTRVGRSVKFVLVQF